MQDLCRQEKLLTEKYICIAEEINVDGESMCIVICMTPMMSKYLMAAKRLTIDTAFKRVYGMDEFEIETWHDNGKKCTYSLLFILSMLLLMIRSYGSLPGIHNIAVFSGPSRAIQESILSR